MVRTLVLFFFLAWSNLICFYSHFIEISFLVCYLNPQVFFSSVQLLSHVSLCNPMDCSTPGFPVHHQLLELTQTHLHWVGDAIQLFHPLSSPSPPAFNLSQYQGLLKCVSSLHQVAKVLEFQLQHESFQWTYGRKWRRTKEPLDENERGVWKSWLKAQHSENYDHDIRSHHFMANRWGNSGWLYFSGHQNHCRWWLQPWN